MCRYRPEHSHMCTYVTSRVIRLIDDVNRELVVWESRSVIFNLGNLVIFLKFLNWTVWISPEQIFWVGTRIISHLPTATRGQRSCETGSGFKKFCNLIRGSCSSCRTYFKAFAFPLRLYSWIKFHRDCFEKRSNPVLVLILFGRKSWRKWFKHKIENAFISIDGTFIIR